MAIFRPFKAIRPLPDKAQEVAALPYDVMSSAEAKEMVEGKPYSFLHVDKAEIDFDPIPENIYTKEIYLKAKENLQKLVSDGVCKEDELPCFYIYRQIMNGRSQTGLVGCTAIDDYINNIIKKHELTRADKEADRINHVDYCDANTGPIFLTYKKNDGISSLVEEWKTSHKPVYDFVTDDGVENTVWVIDDKNAIEKISAGIAATDYLYIADGHHRAASAVKVGLKRREKHPDYTGEEEFNYFLAVLFPKDELEIMDYNRVIKDLNGHSEEEFMNLLSEKFTVEKVGNKAYHPEKKHTFGMFLDGTASMIILAPLFTPIAVSLGISPIQFGIILALNVAIGAVTPPFGLYIYIVSSTLRMKTEKIIVNLIPFIICSVIVLLLVTFIPQLSLLIPELVY